MHLFDDKAEKLVKVEIKIELLSKDILDTRESILTHNNDILSGKAKIKALVDNGLSKLNLKLKVLE